MDCHVGRNGRDSCGAGEIEVVTQVEGQGEHDEGEKKRRKNKTWSRWKVVLRQVDRGQWKDVYEMEKEGVEHKVRRRKKNRI